MISGLSTILQATRVGRVGAGHVLIMGTSGAFIGVCVAAMVEGGPALMASLIAVSSLVQFALAARLSLFTPDLHTRRLRHRCDADRPHGHAGDLRHPDRRTRGGGQCRCPVTALATLATVAALVLRAPPAWRLWSPVIGIIVGCAVGAPFGIYDTELVAEAAWVGVPASSWPGFNFTPDTQFLALLPAFIVVTIVGAVETIGDGIAIQRVSRRRPRATDFRVVQGALNADGVGNLLSGILGTLPNTTYSSSISIAEVTGVAARRVGVVIGATFVVVAFFPKLTALLIAIPAPVRRGIHHSPDRPSLRTGDEAGHRRRPRSPQGRRGRRLLLARHRLSEPVDLPRPAGGRVPRGAARERHDGRHPGGRRDGDLSRADRPPQETARDLALGTESLVELDRFLRAFAAQAKWDTDSEERLASAGEETLAILVQEQTQHRARTNTHRRLVVAARLDGGHAEMEFATVLAGANMEDHLAYLSGLPPAPDEREVSFRLLWHYASRVQHHRYHGVDIVTVSVAGSS